MKRLLIPIFLIGLIINVVSKADAVLLIDTGEPASCCFGFSLYNAVQFTLSEDSYVDSIKTWLFVNDSSAPVQFIYGLDLYSGGNLAGDPIHSYEFNVDDVTNDWNGPEDLNLYLSPDTYWASFKPIVHPGGSGLGTQVQNPSGESAVYDGRWFNVSASGATNSTFALQVEGNVVPEPSTMLLLGSGLLGVFVRRRKRV